MSYKEIIEYIMLGATTVQSCTAVMWNGYQIIPKILKDLDDWMDAKGYKSFDEIRGIALSHIASVEELAKLPAKQAYIDPDKCTSCGICKKVCFYRAIEEGENSYMVNKTDCDGCGLCQQMCPTGAIILE